jgi:hypothetical protein
LSDSPAAQSSTVQPISRAGLSRRAAGIFLALILIAAFVARLHRIGSQCLWADELMSLEITGGNGWVSRALPRGELMQAAPDPTSLNDAAPWWRIIPEMRVESHPPLYFVLLRLWREIFGSSDTALRMLSVIFSVAAVFFFYDFGRLIAGRTAGLWTALIAAAAGPQIIFAQEARSYALLLLTTLWGASMVLRIERNGLTLRRGLLFTASLLAMIFTHYFAIAPLLAIALFILLRLRGPVRWRTFAIMAGTGAIFFVLWGGILITQTRAIAVNDRWLSEHSPEHLQRTRERLAILPLRLIGEPLGTSMESAKGAAVAYLLFPLLVIRRRELLLPLLIFFAAIGLLAALDLTRSTSHLQWVRYALPASPGEYCLLAAALSDRKWLRHIVPLAIVIYALVSMPETYGVEKENYREITRLIDTDRTPLIIHSQTNDLWESIMFLGVQHYESRSRPIAILTSPAPEHLMQQLRPYHQAWLLSGWKTPDPEQTLPGCRVENSWRMPAIGKLVRVRFD